MSPSRIVGVCAGAGADDAVSVMAAIPSFMQKFLIDRAIVPVHWDATMQQMVKEDLPTGLRLERLFFWAGMLAMRDRRQRDQRWLAIAHAGACSARA